jgi:hypothetical protein
MLIPNSRPEVTAETNGGGELMLLKIRLNTMKKSDSRAPNENPAITATRVKEMKCGGGTSQPNAQNILKIGGAALLFQVPAWLRSLRAAMRFDEVFI